MQRGQAREGLRSQAQERLWSRHLRAVDPQAYQGDSAIVHAMKVYDHVIATDMKGISRDLEELTSAVLLLGARLQGVAYSVFRGNEEEPTPSPFRIAEGAGTYESDCVWAREIDGSPDDKQGVKDRLLRTGKGLRDSLFSNTLTYRPLIGVYAAQAMDLVTVRCRCGPYVDNVRDCTRAIMFGSRAVLQTIYVEDRHHKKVMLCESGTPGLVDDVHSKRGTFQVHEVSVGREVSCFP